LVFIQRFDIHRVIDKRRGSNAIQRAGVGGESDVAIYIQLTGSHPNLSSRDPVQPEVDPEIHTEELTVVVDDVCPVGPEMRTIIYHCQVEWELQKLIIESEPVLKSPFGGIAILIAVDEVFCGNGDDVTFEYVRHLCVHASGGV
jgi:hypothetical protein